MVEYGYFLESLILMYQNNLYVIVTWCPDSILIIILFLV